LSNAVRVRAESERFAAICAYLKRLPFFGEASMANRSPIKATRPALTLLIATRKGLLILAGDAKRALWKLQAPHLLGHIVHHAV
jgi:hypothetical protein